MIYFDTIRAALPDTASAAHAALNALESRHAVFAELLAPLGYFCTCCNARYSEDRDGTVCCQCGGRGMIAREDKLNDEIFRG